MRTIFIGLIAVYVIVMIGLTTMQRKILFPRHYTQPYPNAGEGIDGLEKVWIDSPEGKVEGWFIAGKQVTAENPGPLVIFAHGNAELIEYWPVMLAGYKHLGVSLLLPEYRGYGRSAGSPSQEAITEDFVKFYDLMIARPDVDKNKIIFHGRSIGGGAVCALAEQRKPAVLILQSTFTSVKSMAGRFMMPGFLVADPFDNLATVEELDIPILVMHGSQDDLIPYKHGKKLSQAAKNGTLITYACDHNSCPPDWKVFWADIQKFLTSAHLITSTNTKKI